MTERDTGLGEGALHRLTVEQYHQMADAGILDADERVELLEGLLVEKRTKHPPHRIATRCTREALAAVVPDGWYVDAQEPIATDDSEPEPDVAVIRGRTQDYAATNPPASKVGLVVEVAETHPATPAAPSMRAPTTSPSCSTAQKWPAFA